MHQAGLEIGAVVTERFTEPLLHRNIGLWPADFGFYPTSLADSFDLLLFVNETTATRPMVEAAIEERTPNETTRATREQPTIGIAR